MERDGNPDHYYDDDITKTVAEEFTDRISVIFVIGDIIRALGGILQRRPHLSQQDLEKIALQKIKHADRISRKDIAMLTEILEVDGNSFIPFMNGGPLKEHWNKDPNGFYKWIEKSTKTIIGIELGFKSDDYGQEVKKRLIKKKRANPEMYVGLLIDGFASFINLKPEKERDEFQQKTYEMIQEMRKENIDVIINDSWNPLSSDFLAANHIKLWIFDGQAAFVGGIGIESQFMEKLYDEMDLITGSFVNVLTLVALLLFSNQKRSFRETRTSHITELKKNKESFLPTIQESGKINLKIAMNVPGYTQDAQKQYYKLLTRSDVEEIYLMAPYFSDDKIARGLIYAANRLYRKLEKKEYEKMKKNNPQYSEQEISYHTKEELYKNKRIHVVFPKKQENVAIAEVSKYYAYYLKDNPIVETKQYNKKIGGQKHEMLHAKQLLVVLKDDKTGWTKYVKFGGSYNPAGRAHNMWEVNVMAYFGKWESSDDNDEKNPIKDYLENVMKHVIECNSEPFPWGDKNAKVTILERLVMKLAQMIFV